MIPSEYSIEIMADDMLALMDHLNIQRADVMGYSLGADHGSVARTSRNVCARRSSAASASA